MAEIRIERQGFVLYLGGTWMEISNRYGVQQHGDVALSPDDIPDGWAESKLERFITEHTVIDFPKEDIIKKVIYDPESRRYGQIQAVRSKKLGGWMVQKYDDELCFMLEEYVKAEHPDEIKAWIKEKYQVQSGLPAYVLRSKGTGDCTNDGISKSRIELYVMTEGRYPFEPADLRECVGIEKRSYSGEIYVCAKPLYCPRRWYMAGGNFLYTSDSRFGEITGISYPVSIHDRYEGR
ncbi:MAG: hypothetical protein IJL07_09090 [Lachnospiraceae bacterium]|nr:hypothetical protein [Lachnospiraceae bacterium]